MADLKAEIVKAIADACDIEETVAEFGASAVLALPEIRDALERIATLEKQIDELREMGYGFEITDD